MNVTREQVVKEAESWVGTPYMHQQRVKGPKGGVDCVNFIAEVARLSGVIENPDFDRTYNRSSDGKVLLRMLDTYMEQIEIDEVQKADVFTFRNLRDPQNPRWHVAIIADVTDATTYIVHADDERGVVRHRVDALMRQKIHSAWMLKVFNGQQAV